MPPHPLPLYHPCRLGNGLHSISGWFKVGLGWFVNAYSSHSIHNAKEVGSQNTKGSYPMMQGGRFLGCKVMVLQVGGNMEMAMWLYVPFLLGLWCSLGLVPNYVVLVLGNEGGGPHHMQSCHTPGLCIGLRKTIFIKYTNEANHFVSFFTPMFNTMANMNMHFFFYIYQSHYHMYVQWLKVLV